MTRGTKKPPAHTRTMAAAVPDFTMFAVRSGQTPRRIGELQGCGLRGAGALRACCIHRLLVPRHATASNVPTTQNSKTSCKPIRFTASYDVRFLRMGRTV